MERMSEAISSRPGWWKWYICVILGLATTINYLDRQALAVTSNRITSEFKLTDEQYGNLEMGFGLAFAFGAAFFGILVDRISVRWLYPTVLVLWSSVGFMTGYVEGYEDLLVCRIFLGLFEAGHWPCALKTTQWLLPPHNRTLGNSLLQSGSSIGAIITPLMMAQILTSEPGSWRFGFQLIGLAGMAWIFLWLPAVHGEDLPRSSKHLALSDSMSNAGEQVPQRSFWQAIATPRFIVLLVIVAAINICWQTFRAWLPKFVQIGRGYSEAEMLYFNSLYNTATEIGCIAAGAATVWLSRSGMSVHRSKVWVYGGCALLVGLAALSLPWLQKGNLLLGVLLLLAFGSLGLFPCYYSFSQELSVRHQGKISGTLGAFAWLTSSPCHKLFGWYVDACKSHGITLETAYNTGFVVAGLFPLLGLIALLCLWNTRASVRADDARGF
jgi:ACS family hexuronate transporter-like MFS transporter